jgi:hypothetical protein
MSRTFERRGLALLSQPSRYVNGAVAYTEGQEGFIRPENSAALILS